MVEKVPADLLLIVYAHVQGAASVVGGHVSIEAESAVFHQGLGILLCLYLACSGVADRGQKGDCGQEHRHSQDGQGVVEEGETAGRRRHLEGKKAHCQGGGADNSRKAADKGLKAWPYPYQAPPGPLVQLLDLGVELKGLLIVQGLKIHFQQFIPIELVYLVPVGSLTVAFPPVQESVAQGKQSPGDQGQQHQTLQSARVPGSRQFVQDPGRDPDSHIGGDGSCGGT